MSFHEAPTRMAVLLSSPGIAPSMSNPSRTTCSHSSTMFDGRAPTVSAACLERNGSPAFRSRGSLSFSMSPSRAAGFSCRRSSMTTTTTNLFTAKRSHKFSVKKFSVPNRPSQTVVKCQDVKVVANDAAQSPDSASDLQGLLGFITSGALSRKVGADTKSVAMRFDEWCGLGNDLSDFLNFSEGGLSEAEKVRIYQYYLPIYFWCRDQLSVHRSRFAAGETVPPIVIGINAPQGCGKTTVVESLDFLFNSTGRPAAAISVDDFYLTGPDQDKLAADNPDNGLLEFRGNAGSHDLQFGTETLKTLLKLTTKGSKAKVPRYDKGARSGRGDRGDPSSWPLVEGPIEVLLFEGWMLGYEPQDDNAVIAVDPQLALVNKLLESYYDAWYRFINSWIIIQVEDPTWVFEWRLEAEVQMRNKGKGGMTDDQIADFVSRYMPAYKAYLPSFYSAGPRNSTVDNTLKFSINKDRNPIG